METLGLRDIIGPIMVGPSSSHTAGALRIARMARNLLAAPPAHAEITLYGSFACTQSGHGTDKALIAGLLGLAPDDLGIRDSFERARDAGLAFSFTCDANADVEHPNTVDLRIEDAAGAVLDVRGVSVGGGAAVIKRIDGIDVDITGQHTSLVVRQRDEAGVLAHIAGCLSDCDVNIATTRMYRTRRGSGAYTVMEVDGALPSPVKSTIEQHPAVRDVRIVPADRPAETAADSSAPHAGEAEEKFAACDFTTGLELLALCAHHGKHAVGVGVGIVRPAVEYGKRLLAGGECLGHGDAALRAEGE